MGDENSIRNDVKQEVTIEGVESSEVKNVNENDGDETSVGALKDSKEESSSSSSSSSSNDDEESDDDSDKEEEDTKKVKGEVEMEEGEIRDFKVEEMVAWSDDEDGDVVKGPIRSKNEVQHLPLVPAVNATIEPHHQILPVGVVLSSRQSLDEPFQKKKKNNNLYKKGYDASGENDEELDNEIEFSDDEKEAEQKKMLKMSKRGSSEQKKGNAKKDKKLRNRKNNHQPSPNSQANEFAGRLPTNGPGVSPVFSPGPPAPNLARPSGVWPNGFPSIQLQNMGFPPNGFPPNVPYMQPNFNQQPFQNLGLPNVAPFHPQFNTNGQQMFAANLGAFTSWPAGMPLNNFSQLQVGPPMALPFNPSMNIQPQGVVMPNGMQMGNSGGMRPPMGNRFPNPFQRGGGRFQGGQSGPQLR
ncbi:hypothetical protein OSB04_006145 [Centaurea solstitialis]|uniref:Uncharacterized protein n=1 Tax=Centaurea solstitialis TaxID=347529 RepID=A0AA38THD5_9ASTR|nr:hypothetical protein OSB04_006145 [Centaurea solstitialis]